MPNNNYNTRSSKAPYKNKKIVLIIEDDVEMNNLLKMLIRQICECSIEQIYNGTDAIRRINASEEKICLVILDLSLPGVSGQSVLDTILTKNIRVAIITADPIAAQRLVGKVSGVFTKPWNKMEFLAKLTSLLLVDEA